VEVGLKKVKKCLLIDKLINEGWFDNEKEAVPWIMARKVLVNNEPAASAKEKVLCDSTIRIREYYKKKYVNKGGLKLEGALRDFGIDVKGKVALDCGASTGGFTDCLIRHGAVKVYAVDAGNGQLSGKLAIHPDVVNMERMNLGDDLLCMLDPLPEIISLDLSYLSLVKALPICKNIFGGQAGTVVCLVKPIYEVESAGIRRSGKINDKDILRDILRSLYDSFIEQDMTVTGITNSPITGNNGTLEYFMVVRLNDEAAAGLDHVEEHIEAALERSFQIPKFEKDNYVEKKYVTRSGLKLEKALEVFDVAVNEKVCIDIGASEGGFTDCLIRNNAKKVYSVDVAYGILDWKLRNNEKVIPLERTNARYLDESKIQEKCDLITADVSFISINKILPNVKKLLKEEGLIISLYKPQFEVSKELIEKNGNIKNPDYIIDALVKTVSFLKENGIYMRKLTYSPIRGNNGNIEFLLFGDLDHSAEAVIACDLVRQIVNEAFGNPVNK